MEDPPSLGGPIYESFDRFLSGHRDRENFLGRIWTLCDLAKGVKTTPPFLGRLGTKDEPAGKVRVFAMVDPWTQWILHPLHSILFSVLKRIREDATFDQVGKLEVVMKDIMARGYRKAKAFSFDLSAATDRLPVSLQVRILAPLLGQVSAEA